MATNNSLRLNEFLNGLFSFNINADIETCITLALKHKRPLGVLKICKLEEPIDFKMTKHKKGRFWKCKS